jgi:uncharacterized protein (DUF1800 family)
LIPRGKEAAALALHRFGFGPAGGTIATIANDPRGALIADLERPQAGQVGNQVAAANLPSSAQAVRAVFAFRAEERAKRKVAERAKKDGQERLGALADAKSAFSVAAERPEPKLQPRLPPLPARLMQNEAKVRFDVATGAEIGFVERLVWFWSNHFCVSADKVVAMAGPYEREAIRPHVLGRFADLLQAVESHPAMLFYLDNVESIGPNSVAGIDRDKGLNENLARETLELHTLGVRSGYSQADVTNFAKVLTGWTWLPPGEPLHGGEFVFNRLLHEPGPQTVLGKSYPDTGIAQGRAVLADLARHPATARHIAQKLAQHFVADEPPPALVGKLEKTFRDSDGDLKQLAKTLITADESWTPQRSKLKKPSEWIAGALRMTGAQSVIPVPRLMGAQAMLGEALWRPPAPNGFSDGEAAWIDGIPHRLDMAHEFAGRVANQSDPLTMLDENLGPLASAQTRQTVARAESRTQAVALLLMAPEFLRR